jgi:hypothetical protein
MPQLARGRLPTPLMYNPKRSSRLTMGSLKCRHQGSSAEGLRVDLILLVVVLLSAKHGP